MQYHVRLLNFISVHQHNLVRRGKNEGWKEKVSFMLSCVYTSSRGSCSVVSQTLREDKWKCIMTALYSMSLCSSFLQTSDIGGRLIWNSNVIKFCGFYYPAVYVEFESSRNLCLDYVHRQRLFEWTKLSIFIETGVCILSPVWFRQQQHFRFGKDCGFGQMLISTLYLMIPATADFFCIKPDHEVAWWMTNFLGE